MDEAGFRADDFGQVREEGDDIMLHLALDLVDAIDIEGRGAALLPDLGGGFFRDHAELGQRIGGMGLDLEPDAEFGFRRPDGGHLGACVTGDHVLIRPS